MLLSKVLCRVDITRRPHGLKVDEFGPKSQARLPRAGLFINYYAILERGMSLEMGLPQIFEHAIRVRAADIDGQGHVNNVVYLRYAQDAAVAHWKTAAPPEVRESLSWVTRRHEIDYLRPAFLDDDLIARTWIESVAGASMERRIDIVRPSDATHLIRVLTLWVAVDPGSHRPKRIDDRLKTLFLGTGE
jgi:acyl-CoA thioester hydrolase